MAALKPGEIGFLHVSVDDETGSGYCTDGSTPSPLGEPNSATPTPSPCELATPSPRDDGSETPGIRRSRSSRDRELRSERKHKRRHSSRSKDGLFDSGALTPGIAFQVITVDLLTELGDELGHGAHGRVFLATYGGERVAVKTMLADSPHSSEVTEFVRELGLLSQLKDRNVVRFVGGSVEAPFLLVTEYCARGTLFEFLHRGLEPDAQGDTKLAPYDPLALVTAIASGMAYLERHQIIHRDLKSENVLLTAELEPKISDFGFAKQHALGSQAALQSIVGSPNYVAPEVAKDGYYNNRCDVFSFGTVAWETFSREIPFATREYGSSIMTQLMDICEHGVRAGVILQSWPPHVQTLIALCWRTRPTERPSFASIVSVLRTPAVDVPPTPTADATPVDWSGSNFLDSRAHRTSGMSIAAASIRPDGGPSSPTAAAAAAANSTAAATAAAATAVTTCGTSAVALATSLSEIAMDAAIAAAAADRSEFSDSTPGVSAAVAFVVDEHP